MMNFKSVLGISVVGIALLGNGVLASAAVTDNLNESQSSMVINTKDIRDLNVTFEYNYFDNDQLVSQHLMTPITRLFMKIII